MKSKIVVFFIAVLITLITCDLVMLYLLNRESSDSIAINISGRQRMLSQKIVKEVLLVESKPEYKSKLSETVRLFDESLKDLIAGNEKQGLSPAIDPQVIKQLQKEKLSKLEENEKPTRFFVAF